MKTSASTYGRGNTCEASLHDKRFLRSGDVAFPKVWPSTSPEGAEPVTHDFDTTDGPSIVAIENSSKSGEYCEMKVRVQVRTIIMEDKTMISKTHRP